jgi:GxxExxY protein
MKTEIYKDEGYRFMGAAFEVYNDRGYGLAEEIYQECLEIELEMRQRHAGMEALYPLRADRPKSSKPLNGLRVISED